MALNGSRLNDLIGSRICHDLISPLGAIGNGVELLTMSGTSTAPEISLIAESVENANARIRFFRIAFGAASGLSQIGNAEVRSVLADLYRGNRIRVDWRITEDTLRIEAKLAFLVIQCFESAMPWGGKVAVTRNGDDWNIYGSADRMKIEPELWNLATDPSKGNDIAASNVHFALLSPTSEAANCKIKTATNGNSISVSF